MTLSSFDVMSGQVGPALFSGAGITSFAVSPDGQTVVVMDRSPRLTMVDRSTGRARSETTAPGAGFLQEGVFTPDGKTLIVSGAEFEQDRFGMAALDLNGRGTMLATSSNQWIAGPRVSPDGRHLAYTTLVLAGDVWLVKPNPEP
jgi:Tol biopolymer transport system component